MTSNRVLRFALAAFPLLLLVSYTRASTQSIQSTQDKRTELCTKLARFDTAVAALKSMSPSSTVGDFREAQEQVRTTFDDVKTSAKTVQNAKTEDLERAYQELDRAIRAVPNNDS